MGVRVRSAAFILRGAIRLRYPENVERSLSTAPHLDRFIAAVVGPPVRTCSLKSPNRSSLFRGNIQILLSRVTLAAAVTSASSLLLPRTLLVLSAAW